MATSILLHSGVTWPGSVPLLAIVTAGAVGTSLLLALAVTAFVRRQSRSYFLIAAAFAALLGRSIVVGLTLNGILTPTGHHLLEHTFDVILVALVIAAVYYARTIATEAEFET